MSSAREPDEYSDPTGSRDNSHRRVREFAAAEKFSDASTGRLLHALDLISELEVVDPVPRPYLEQAAAFERIWDAWTVLGAQVLSLTPAESMKLQVELHKRGFPDLWLDQLRDALQSVYIEGRANKAKPTKPAVIERRLQYVAAIAYAVKDEAISVDKSSEPFIDLCQLIFTEAGISSGAINAVEAFSRSGRSAEFKRQRRGGSTGRS